MGDGDGRRTNRGGVLHSTSARGPHSEETLRSPSKPALQDEAGGETEALVDRTQQHTSQRQDLEQESMDMQEAEGTECGESRSPEITSRAESSQETKLVVAGIRVRFSFRGTDVVD